MSSPEILGEPYSNVYMGISLDAIHGAMNAESLQELHKQKTN